MFRRILFLIMAIISTNSLTAGELKPFVLPWDDSEFNITNIGTRLNFTDKDLQQITIGKDAHFYVGDKRIKLLGVNLCFEGNFPEKEAAEKIAARMAKFGINCVRFHHMDMQRFPAGIMKAGGQNSRELDPEALDRLDYLIAQLKKHGIYADINLLVSRQFSAADDLPKEIEQLGWKDQHVIGFFDHKMQMLQMEYASNLLSHQNPYTKTSYISDPAVAIVEINNENGLLQAWFGGVINYIPEIYKQELAEQWNAWLKNKYENMDKLNKSWGNTNVPLSEEILKNADFSNKTDNWLIEQHGTAKAENSFSKDTETSNSILKINVINASDQGWHVQFNQSNLKFEKDKLYTLSFKAKADSQKKMNVAASQAHEPWQELGWNANIELNDEWKQYSFSFKVAENDDNGRINFSNMGNKTGDFYFKEISLKEGGIIGLSPEEGFEKKNIPLCSISKERAFSNQVREDFISFLRDTEEKYWTDMYKFLKNDLKIKAVVMGTIISCSTPNLMAKMDAVDAHTYWQHPTFPGKSWDMGNWLVGTTSMVNESGGPTASMALQRVYGKPFTVTEYNHSFPNPYSSEAPLLLATVAGLQDWDAIFMFAYAHDRSYEHPGKMSGFFDIDQHPTKMANMIIAANMFSRGDVSAAKTELKFFLNYKEELEVIRDKGGSWSMADAGKVGAKKEYALINKIGMDIRELRPPDEAPIIPNVDGMNIFNSDTGEIKWDISRKDKGVVIINSKKTKAVIGFIDGRTFDFGEVKIIPAKTMLDWCTIAMTIMKGEDFTKKSNSLLVLTGLAENTNMGWKNPEKTTVGNDWGDAPSLIEVIPAEIELTVPAGSVKVWSLDEKGNRAKEVEVKDKNGKATFNVDETYGTLWYEIEIK